MPIARLISGYRSTDKADTIVIEEVGSSEEESQNPGVLWIGCSDSRVIPERIADVGPGEIFVIRNVANIVPPYGTAGESVGAAIEYAVINLRVPHIVICGHTDCGGIKALDKTIDLANRPYLSRWLEWARPAHNQVVSIGIPDETRHQEMVRSNVIFQQQNLKTYPSVRDATNSGRLELHAWVYDLMGDELFSFDANNGEWKVIGAKNDEVN
jgi:carbonic anhydrase